VRRGIPGHRGAAVRPSGHDGESAAAVRPVEPSSRRLEQRAARSGHVRDHAAAAAHPRVSGPVGRWSHPMHHASAAAHPRVSGPVGRWSHPMHHASCSAAHQGWVQSARQLFETPHERESGPGGLTREVEMPMPSNHPRFDQLIKPCQFSCKPNRAMAAGRVHTPVACIPF
jgi:hypothetical protein